MENNGNSEKMRTEGKTGGRERGGMMDEGRVREGYGQDKTVKGARTACGN